MNWAPIATFGTYSVWAREQAGSTIYQLSKTQPSEGAGGYFTIDAAVKVKGFNLTRLKRAKAEGQL